MAAGILDRQPVDFNYFLSRKYALLAQNADADTSRASSAAVSAIAGATAADAAAKLDITKAGLLPAESAAAIAQQQAQARLLGEQASVVRPESAARIGQIGAETGLTNINARIAYNEGLVRRPGIGAGGLGAIGGGLGSSLGSIMGAGARALPALDLSGPLPRRLPGETDAEYLDRSNGIR